MLTLASKTQPKKVETHLPASPVGNIKSYVAYVRALAPDADVSPDAVVARALEDVFGHDKGRAFRRFAGNAPVTAGNAPAQFPAPTLATPTNNAPAGASAG